MEKTNQNIYEPIFVKDLFNRMSSSYERMNYITSFGFSIRWRRQFIFQFQKSHESVKILDLFCGMGETWSFIKKRYPNAEIIALDFSDGMIKYAEKRNVKYFENKVTIINEDIFKNSLTENTFDYVFCGFGLKTFNNEQLDFLAKEVDRILKPNGKFSFVEVSKPQNSFLNFFYKKYLTYLIPVFGKLFLGNPDEYKMLWKYTEKFNNSEKVLGIFNANNLKTSYQCYFFGCATGISGGKL